MLLSNLLTDKFNKNILLFLLCSIISLVFLSCAFKPSEMMIVKGISIQVNLQYITTSNNTGGISGTVGTVHV